ncbi:MAG: Rieske 2Fe-2S domain-containing protein [Ardenticatenia bacterium]|nr:Rieske 2Fe-2S domain-containing protein [Ardenticatenia bacterium]
MSRAQEQAQSQSPAVKPITRRELLNYIWLGSLGVFLAEFAGLGVIFAFPRFREGEFGGVFRLGPAAQLPEVGSSPQPNSEGKFWLVHLPEGVLALYRVCTHLGCLYNWQEAENKFICPCHGSQFQKDGTYITGPAPRSLDRFVVRVIDPNTGQVVAETDPKGKGPVAVPGEEYIIAVDTGALIRGDPR